jgi:myo-inositol 2-dehydrogenase/D-chiro-inositol 1-dehydrogenase
MDMGVIGTGRMGQLHVSLMLAHPLINRVWVFDPFIDKKWVKTVDVNVASSVGKLIEKSSDGVFIASPSEQHLTHVQEAAKAKRAVFCEKPIGFNADEIKACLSFCAKQNVILQLGFNRRFDPSIMALKHNIEKHVGMPQVIKITSRDPFLPARDYLEKSGGLFNDMMIHDFDMARFLSGSEVIEVFSHGSCLIDKSLENINDIDTALVQLRFKNGALGVIDNSRKAVYGYDQRVEVFSNKGTLKVGNPLKEAVEHVHTEGKTQSRLPTFFLDRYRHSYKAQLDAFIESVLNKKSPGVTGFDGLQALCLAEAAKKSLDEKKVVVIQSSKPMSDERTKNNIVRESEYV